MALEVRRALTAPSRWSGEDERQLETGSKENGKRGLEAERTAIFEAILVLFCFS